jgi:hypothetical protein
MCAHGSGGRSCLRLLPAQTSLATLVGGRMGGGARLGDPFDAN